MCCNYREPARLALRLIKDQTGLTIPQSRWHEIREAAEERLRAEGRLGMDQRLSNQKKADLDEVVRVCTEFAAELDAPARSAKTFVSQMTAAQPRLSQLGVVEQLTWMMQNGQEIGVPARNVYSTAKSVPLMDVMETAGFTRVVDGQRRVNTLAAVRRSSDPRFESHGRIPAGFPDTPSARWVEAMQPVLDDVNARKGYVRDEGVLLVVGPDDDARIVTVLPVRGGLEGRVYRQNPDGSWRVEDARVLESAGKKADYRAETLFVRQTLVRGAS